MQVYFSFYRVDAGYDRCFPKFWRRKRIRSHWKGYWTRAAGINLRSTCHKAPTRKEVRDKLIKAVRDFKKEYPEYTDQEILDI